MSPTLQTVPHLTTAQSGPLHEIESHLLERRHEIESWFRKAWLATPAPFYASVDLRNAGFKLAPVDTNLFPAGFNNLNPDFQPLCIQAIQSAMEHVCPQAERLVIIPEKHTRNLFYLESVATLRDIAEQAGFEVSIGSINPEHEEPAEFDLPSGRRLRMAPVERRGRRIEVDGHSPCAILLNNDLAGGRPDVLEGLEQEVIPPLALGWSDRRKSAHFAAYEGIVEEFARLVDLDPWLISPLFARCEAVDFLKREGEQCLAESVDNLLARIRRKYAQYGIERDPFVVIKADAGTYGMGIMTATSPDDVRGLNRKQRTRMARTKESQNVDRVILQEGVYTFETIGDEAHVAEPVVYMIDHFVVGGFYRVHTRKGDDESLNAPGAHFEPLAFANTCTTPDNSRDPDAEPNRFYAYGVIARLALLAAAREAAELEGGSR